MYKIAVMGDRDSVMGFKVLGLDVFPVTDPEIILIPGKEGSLGIGMSKVSESVERAIGANIL